MKEIRYGVPIEVSKDQYKSLIVKFAGLIAHRKDNEGKYWIKLWHMKFKKDLQLALQ